jgi:OTU domain-containing protein 6
VCSKIENTSEWGGELELRALAHALETPIRVFSVSHPIEFGDQFAQPSLLLSYHKHYYSMGAHYNSVIDSAAEQ